MFLKDLMRNMDPDPAAGGGDSGGGGAAAVADAGGDENVIKFTSDALKERLQRTARSAVQEFQAKLAESGRLLSEEDAKKLKEERETREAEELKAQQESGRYKEILDAREKEFAQKERVAVERATALERELHNAKIENALNGALVDKDVPRLRPDAKADDVKGLLRQTGAIRVDKNGGVYIANGEGDPIYSKQRGRESEPMTVSEFVADFLAERPYYVAPSGSFGSGSGGAGARVSLPDNFASNEVYEKLSPAQKEAARAQIRAHRTDEFTMRPKTQ